MTNVSYCPTQPNMRQSSSLYTRRKNKPINVTDKTMEMMPLLGENLTLHQEEGTSPNLSHAVLFWLICNTGDSSLIQQMFCGKPNVKKLGSQHSINCKHCFWGNTLSPKICSTRCYICGLTPNIPRINCFLVKLFSSLNCMIARQ